jgi:hypothetical protein
LKPHSPNYGQYQKQNMRQNRRINIINPVLSCPTYTTDTLICEDTSLPPAKFSLDSGIFPALTSAACCMTSWTACKQI